MTAPPQVDALTDPWNTIQCVTPTSVIRVKGGVQQVHIFDKGGGGAEMSPPSKEPATVWQALHQVLIQGG